MDRMPHGRPGRIARGSRWPWSPRTDPWRLRVGRRRSGVITNDSPTNRLPLHLDNFECFAELERLAFGKLFGTVPHARLEFGPITDLRDMGAQCIDLAIECP